MRRLRTQFTLTGAAQIIVESLQKMRVLVHENAYPVIMTASASVGNPAKFAQVTIKTAVHTHSALEEHIDGNRNLLDVGSLPLVINKFNALIAESDLDVDDVMSARFPQEASALMAFADPNQGCALIYWKDSERGKSLAWSKLDADTCWPKGMVIPFCQYNWPPRL